MNCRTVRKAGTVLLMSLVACGLSVSAAHAGPRPGSLDTGYGTGGSALSGFASGSVNGYLLQMQTKPDGSALTFGTASDRFAIGKFNPDGSLNASYADGGFASGGFSPDGEPFIAFHAAVQSDDKVVVDGSKDILNSSGKLLRYDADGNLDKTFGTGGVVNIPGDPREIGVDSQDRIVVVTPAGFKTTIYRFERDGKADPTFGNNGSATFDFSGTSGYSGLSLAAGRITLTSPFEGALRLTPDGTPDPGFGAAGVAKFEIRSMVVQPDGQIVVVDGSAGVFRLRNDGSLDPDFGPGGVTHVAAASNAVTLDPSGRIIVGGVTIYLGPTSPKDFETFRLTPEGDLDPTWGDGGIARTDLAPLQGASSSEDTINAISALSDGSVIAGGVSQATGGIESYALARYTPSGVLDTGYGNGTGVVIQRPRVPSDDRALALLPGPDLSLLTIGKAGSNTGMARYNPNGGRDQRFGDGGRLSTRLTDGGFGETADSGASLPGGQMLVCSSSKVGSALVIFDANGSPASGFGDGGVAKVPSLRRCYSTLVDSDGRIIVGGIDALNVVRIARFSADGELDTSYGVDGYVTGPQLVPSGGGIRRDDFDLAPNGDLVVAGDKFGVTVARFTDRGLPRHSFGTDGIVKLDGFGGSPARMARANAIDVTSAGNIVIAGATRGGGAIAKLKPNGTPVKAFGKKGLIVRTALKGAEFEDVHVQSNGTIVAAGSAHGACPIVRLGCVNRVLLVRYRPTGKPDLRFGRKGVVLKKFELGSKATSILVGSRFIYVAGFATTAADRQQFLLTRFRR